MKIFKHKFTGNRFSIKQLDPTETIGTYFVLDDFNQQILEKTTFGFQPKIAICKTENMIEFIDNELKLF